MGCRRDFTSTDPNAPRQAVVNERFVRMVFGGGNVIGEHVTSAGEKRMRSWE